MTFTIVSQAVAVPSTVIHQEEAELLARGLCCRSEKQPVTLPIRYSHTGVRTRHSALPRPVVDDLINGTRHSGSVFLPTGANDDRGPTTGDRMQCYQSDSARLGVEACHSAILKSRLQARDLTHLITVSCTGFFAPGVDYTLMRELGLAATIQRTHVGFMGCHGALNGLRVAQAFARSDPASRILLCAVELCSLHCHYGTDPQKMIGNAIFSDGCAAVVGVPHAAGQADSWKIIGTGSFLIPDSADAMTWTIGDHGFEMTLSKRVPSLIARHLRPALESWLEHSGRRLSDIRSWAIHPGGPRILDAAQHALGLTTDHTATSRDVFSEFGNMSSPTILFIIDRLRRQNAPRPCLALAFGPGLIAEAVLFG